MDPILRKLAIDQVRDRWAAATAGPWHWRGHAASHDIHLRTVDRGGLYVLTFERWGFRGGQPWFQPKEGVGLVKASEMLEFRTTYDKEIVGIDHPDARAIAAAPADVALLLDEVDRLNDELKDARKRLDATLEIRF